MRLRLQLPQWSVVKKPACSAGDPGSFSGSERCPGEGNGNLLQYSGLGDPMDRGARRATVHGVAQSQTWLKRWSAQPTTLRGAGRGWLTWGFVSRSVTDVCSNLGSAGSTEEF